MMQNTVPAVVITLGLLFTPLTLIAFNAPTYDDVAFAAAGSRIAAAAQPTVRDS